MRNPRNDLTAEYVKATLDYDRETGEFRWRWRDGLRACDNSRCAGTVAGRFSQGYRRIKIDGRNYQAHRLAWLIVAGMWPVDEMDHINLAKDDNRIANLREATHGENHHNTRAYSNNTSGVKNVFWCKREQKWRAPIRHNGKQINLGYFATKEEAAAAVAEARVRLHGEFARAA